MPTPTTTRRRVCTGDRVSCPSPQGERDPECSECSNILREADPTGTGCRARDGLPVLKAKQDPNGPCTRCGARALPPDPTE